MTGRVLNFSEFQDKYSTEGQQDAAAALSDFSAASDNFQTGFDDATYDSPQLGPKRPISGGSEMTPAQPGEMGSPSFNPFSSGMEAPTEDEYSDEEGDETSTNPSFGQYSTSDSGDPEAGDEDDTEEDDDTDEDDTDEDEEKKEKEDTSESRFWNRRSSSVILESFDSFSGDDYSWQPHESFGNIVDSSYPTGGEESGNWIKCKSCGDTMDIPAGHDPFAEENVDDPSHWWQGQEVGMQCGCNM